MKNWKVLLKYKYQIEAVRSWLQNNKNELKN